MKTPKKLVLILGSLVIIMALLAAIFYAVFTFLDHQEVTQSSDCTGAHTNHKVIISNSTVSPAHTDAPRCDTLTIVNTDSEDRLIAFGLHDHHEPYDGITEQLLKKGQSLTVTLRQTGNFMFHDHLHDEVQGTFTVTSSN